MARPRKMQATEDVMPTSSQYGETVALEESLAVAPIPEDVAPISQTQGRSPQAGAAPGSFGPLARPSEMLNESVMAQPSPPSFEKRQQALRSYVLLDTINGVISNSPPNSQMFNAAAAIRATLGSMPQTPKPTQ
tara:strand:+ start:847 stop:1248 length:402 start_codon:yes stop_codon:yes gene_type:complete